RFGDDDWMPVRPAKFCLEADVLAMIHKPFGASVHVRFVLFLRGNAWQAKEGAKFRHEAGLILFQVIEDGLHKIWRARRYTRFIANARRYAQFSLGETKLTLCKIVASDF